MERETETHPAGVTEYWRREKHHGLIPVPLCSRYSIGAVIGRSVNGVYKFSPSVKRVVG